MKKKIFACSDIHGHATILKESLKQAGFEVGNKNHLLVCLGDYFDRGEESLEAFQFLKSLGDQVVCLYGNHEEFTEKFLEGPVSTFNFIYNGFNKTLDSFLQQTRAFETYSIIKNEDFSDDLWYEFTSKSRKKINENFPDLISWIKSMPYYFETKNYIFTHGTLDGKAQDWKNPNCSWKELTWAKPYDFTQDFKNIDKTLVLGHINTGMIREQYYNEDGDNNDIFIRPDGKVIGLDTCTILTKKINILVIEDELI